MLTLDWIGLDWFGLGMGLGDGILTSGIAFDRWAECHPMESNLAEGRNIRLIASACKHAHYSLLCKLCEL
jgi:hypothetical protein